jgi:hypothetical protein
MTKIKEDVSEKKASSNDHQRNSKLLVKSITKRMSPIQEPATILNFRAKVLSGGSKLQALAQMIPALHDIAVIDISHNQLDDASIASLLCCLHRVALSRQQAFGSLNTLVLGHNRIGVKSVQALRQVILEEVLPMRGLRIALSGVHLAQELFDEVCDIFGRRRGLNAIDLSDMGWGASTKHPASVSWTS